MASQEWSFTGPKAHRAKRVVPEVWEKYKAELTDLYEKNSLEEVMLQMKISKDFCPSKRQYIYQFEQWGFQKYNKSVNGVGSANSFHVSSSSIESVKPTSNHDQASSVSFNPVPRVTKRKCVEPKQYEKRPKLSDIKDVNDHDQSVSESQASQDTLSAPSLTPHASETSICLLERWDLTVATTEAKRSRDGSVALSKARQKLDRPNSSENTTPESTQSLSQIDGPDLVDLLYTLSIDQMDDIIAAADFLAASQCPNEAFLLFFLLLTRHWNRKDVPQQMLVCALIGCARNAVYEWHIFATNVMLKAYVHDLELQGSTKNSLQKVIYSRLMEEVLTKKDVKPHTIRPSRLAAKTVWPEYSLFEALDDKKPLVLEMAYQNNKNGRQVLSSAGLDQIGLQEPTWVHMIEDLEIGNVIRQFLRWCQSTLKHKVFIRRTSRWRLADLSHTYYTFLYHGLFQAYLEDDKDVLQSQPSQWAKLAKKGMGLSPTRFLANVALMLSKRVGAGYLNLYATEGTNQVQSRLWNESAILTCKKLLLSSDKDLVYDFLSQHYLISSGFLGSSDFELGWYENQFRVLVKDQVKVFLTMNLPKDDKVQALWRTQLPNFLFLVDDLEDSASEKKGVNVPNDAVLADCTPTLAGPMPSSEYHILETLRDQLQEVSKESIGPRGSTASSNARLQKSWSRLTSDSWSLSRYISISSRGSMARSQSSWSSLSRYVSGRRSQGGTTVIESIVTDCSRISISAGEPEADVGVESSIKVAVQKAQS